MAYLEDNLGYYIEQYMKKSRYILGISRDNLGYCSVEKVGSSGDNLA